MIIVLPYSLLYYGLFIAERSATFTALGLFATLCGTCMGTSKVSPQP